MQEWLNAPTHFNGKRIKYRFPYMFAGELGVAASTSGNTFPDATFLHNVELPFEIWRMRVRLSALDVNGDILDGPFFTLGRRIRLNVQETSKNQRMTKSPSLVDLVINSEAGAEGDWKWRKPYTLERAEGYQIEVDALSYVNLANVVTIRVEIAFQGALIVLDPPSETR